MTSSFIQFHLFQRVVCPQEKREDLRRLEYPAVDLPTFPPKRMMADVQEVPRHLSCPASLLLPLICRASWGTT